MGRQFVYLTEKGWLGNREKNYGKVNERKGEHDRTERRTTRIIRGAIQRRTRTSISRKFLWRPSCLPFLFLLLLLPATSGYVLRLPQIKPFYDSKGHKRRTCNTFHYTHSILYINKKCIYIHTSRKILFLS